MKRLREKLAICGAALVVCCLLDQNTDAKTASRMKLRINDNWRFRPGPLVLTDLPGEGFARKWEKVTLPHTWNAADVLDDEPGYRRGVSVYRRQLMLDRRFRNKRIFVSFEGVNQVASVSVNGHDVGRHVGGYTGFSFEITDAVRFGVLNEIAIRVDNTHDRDIPPIDGDFNMYGGIYRDVWLIATDHVYLETADVSTGGITITTPTVSAASAVVEMAGAVVNAGDSVREVEISTGILDPRGRRVASALSTIQIGPRAKAEFKQTSGRIGDPLLWSPDHPNLYTVRTQVKQKNKVVDEVSNPLGFRWFKFDAKEGFFLNGSRLKLRGTNRHQDRAGLGNAVPDPLHVRDLEIIKQNGFNFLRLAHYPQDPAVLEAADRLGLLIWEEIPIVNQIHVSEEFNANARNMLREMIRQHRNHPSIVIWGYMNEVFLPVPKTDAVVRATVDLARQLEDICRREDPTRATAIAFDWGARDLYNSSGLGEVTQIVGWNLYHGWYYETFEDFGKFLDDQHRKFPGRVMIVSEFGANGDRRVHSLAPKRFDSSIEWQRAFHESYLPQIESRPFVAGSAIWNQFDFGSEFRGETIPHINQKGMYTFDRMAKDISHFYRAAYHADRFPVLHIAVDDRPRQSGPRSQTIAVYSNLDRITLFHNGRSLGTRSAAASKKAEWTVDLVDGRNSLMAVDSSTSPAVRDDAFVEYVDPGKTDLTAINCGSHTEFVDDRGTIWQADLPAPSASWRTTRNASTTQVETRQDILGTIDEPIFQTMREGASVYSFTAPDGAYEIELRFVETKFKSAGQRVFSVRVNGQTLIDRLDLAAEPGPMQAHSRVLRAGAAGGSGITVELVPVTGLPIVSGIRLKRVN